MKTRIAAALLLGLALALTGCTLRPAGTPKITETPAVTAAPTESPAPTPSPTPEPSPEPTPSPTPLADLADDELVRVSDYAPDIIIDLRYATQDNFTGQVIYDFDEAYLRCGTLKKLIEVQAELMEAGRRLVILDAYRPVAAQFALWEACPDPVFVANPNYGYSSHSRGNTVDVTLADAEGVLLPMPSEFDEFSALADRDYSDASAEGAENARLLENAMVRRGFHAYSAEWWHYTDNTDYPVSDAA